MPKDFLIFEVKPRNPKMTHEKIYTRENGSKVKVSVWLYVQQNQPNWSYLIFLQEPQSERWLDPFSDRDYLSRMVQPGFHQGLPMDLFDHYVSKEEILEAKLELWKKIQPE